jgi:hypothetical protein
VSEITNKKHYTVTKLIKRLQEVEAKYGDIEIRMCTETDKTGQVEQAVADLAVSQGYKKVVILLPEGF